MTKARLQKSTLILIRNKFSSDNDNTMSRTCGIDATFLPAPNPISHSHCAAASIADEESILSSIGLLQCKAGCFLAALPIRAALLG